MQQAVTNPLPDRPTKRCRHTRSLTTATVPSDPPRAWGTPVARPQHVAVRPGRGCDLFAGLLSLALCSGCAHSRIWPTALAVPQPPPHAAERPNASAGIRNARDTTNEVSKRPMHSAEDRAQAVSQMGSGATTTDGTTGVTAPALVSGSSSVVITRPAIGSTNRGPAAAGDARGSRSLAPTPSVVRRDVGAVLLACGLIVAIVWLPRWTERR